jgi:uncharacterized protein (UPF0218 family)
MLKLPEHYRHFFKEPFGRLFSDISDVIPHVAGCTVYTVGDVVTHNLRKHNIAISVAIIDGHTMRSPCKKGPLPSGRIIKVRNPAGSITEELIAGLQDAVENPPATIDVSGEEDLAVIPLVIAAPQGSAVLYGQPHKGVVLCAIDREAKARAAGLFARFIQTTSG